MPLWEEFFTDKSPVSKFPVDNTVVETSLLLKVVIIPLLLTFASILTLPLLWEVKEILSPATKVLCKLSIKSEKLDSVGKSPVLK